MKIIHTTFKLTSIKVKYHNTVCYLIDTRDDLFCLNFGSPTYDMCKWVERSEIDSGDYII